MIVDRIFTTGLAQVAYLVADEQSGEVAVIDPRRDVDDYLAWAETRGLRITAILETHVHADFVSGACELAAATGAPIFASRLGEVAFPHQPLDDGDEVQIGPLTLRSFWTPGHTPEHLAFLLFAPKRSDNPIALFSGDALFVGEVGRPDLLGEEQTRGLAEQLYHTIGKRLSQLPDDVVVYPGHTAGSSCGKKIGDAPQTTIGQERRFNYAMQPKALASQEAFIETVLANMPVPPTYYPTMKRVNKLGPSLLREIPEGAALAPGEVERRVAAGALLVDARSPEAFVRGHITSSFFGGNQSDFINWVGWRAPYDREVILVLDDEHRYPDLLTELRRIGIDTVAGYLAGGVAAWERSGHAVVKVPTITVEALQTRLADANGSHEFVLLDVRSADEWRSGHVDGAVHRFVGEIARGADIPVNGAETIAVTCASGYRSTVAISLLEARGRNNLINVVGGMNSWQEADLPMETP